MAQYIDKSALIAEIERRIKVLQNNPYENHKTICHLDSLKQYVNTLEVKEVDLEKELQKLNKEIVDDNGFFNTLDIAKHFFELGLKAKDWEKERMEECPYRQVGCTMYEDKVLECRGACSWVVDYPKLKELKA